jgi:hypothetical protein
LNKIVIRDWSYTCGDGCCYDYGREIIVNDGDPISCDSLDVEELKEILTALNIEYEIEYVDDTE